MRYAARETLIGSDLSLEEKFRHAAELGFDGIELIPREGAGFDGMMGDATDRTRAQVEQIGG